MKDEKKDFFVFGFANLDNASAEINLGNTMIVGSEVEITASAAPQHYISDKDIREFQLSVEKIKKTRLSIKLQLTKN